MYKISGLFWALLLVLSVAWIGLGSFLTSEHFDSGNLGSGLSSEIQSLGSDIQVDALGNLPLPVFFLATGLPFALIALFFLWRIMRRYGASVPVDQETSVRRQSLKVSFLALIFALLIWSIWQSPQQSAPQAEPGFLQATISSLLWPVRLFVTFVHEAGHAIATLLTGGIVEGFTVLPDGQGYAQVGGGYRALSLPAGYLGAALFGSALFFLTSRIPDGRAGYRSSWACRSSS